MFLKSGIVWGNVNRPEVLPVTGGPSGRKENPSEKTPEVKGKRRNNRLSPQHPPPGSRHIPVLMLLRQFNRFPSPSWISRVPSAMPLRAKVTNPAFRGTAMVCSPSRREARLSMLIFARCRHHQIFPKNCLAMSPTMCCSTRSTASAALSSTDPKSSTP